MSHHHNFFIMGLLDFIPIIGPILNTFDKGMEDELITKPIEQRHIKQQTDWFNMVADYNSPSSQRERLQEAGYNPNWTGASQPVTMGLDVNASQPSGSSNLLNSISQLTQAKSQQEAVESQKGVNKSIEQKNYAEAFKATEEAKDVQNKNNNEYWTEQVNQIKNIAEQAKSQSELLQSQKKYQDVVNDYAVTLQLNEIAKIEAEIAEKGANKDLLNAKTESENKLRSYVARKYDAEIADLLMSAYQKENQVRQEWQRVKNDTERVSIEKRQMIGNLFIQSQQLEINRKLAYAQETLWYNEAEFYKHSGIKANQEAYNISLETSQRVFYNTVYQWLIDNDLADEWGQTLYNAVYNEEVLKGEHARLAEKENQAFWLKLGGNFMSAMQSKLTPLLAQ